MIKYQKRFKYQLVEDYSGSIKGEFPNHVTHHYFTLNKDGSYLIFSGYAWDGPSGPTIDTSTFMRGSLVHDVLYQAIRLELIPLSFRKRADEILREVCLEDGMTRLRAWLVYRGVRLGAGASALPSRTRKVYYAP